MPSRFFCFINENSFDSLLVNKKFNILNSRVAFRVA